MPGISAIFNIAKGALQANQIAMEVVSHNIANVNTPGYTRQKVLLESEAPLSLTQLKLGMGVRLTSVVQVFDRYTTRTIHQNTSALTEYESKASILAYLESLLNETNGQTLSQAINEFWNAWQDLATNPGGTAERTALLGKSEILCQNFHSLSNELNQVIQNINFNLGTAVEEVNSLSEKIAQLNERIATSEASQATANDLRDQRNNLLEELSGLMGIVYLENENGSVTVMTSKGILLVNENQHWEFRKEGENIYWNDIEKDISDSLVGGKIGGWLDMRDEIVPEYLANLDELAGTLMNQVNTRHLTGYTLSGETGKYFFENFLTAPEVPNPADYKGAAAYIRLSSDVLNTPSNIAAGGQSGDPGDNENALNIVGIQTDDSLQIRKWTITDRGNTLTSSLQTETLDDYYRTLVGEIGILTEEFNDKQDFVENMLDRLGEIRSSISGVNIDEELTELMKIQRAHEAAAKLVITADEMLQSILEMR